MLTRPIIYQLHTLCDWEENMKVYRGDRTIDGLDVTVDGAPLDPRFDVRVVSPDGFEWSYEGAAPAQLALALLMDHFGASDRALAHHETFMREIVANFNNEWEMTSADIDAVLDELGISGANAA
jgi:uncharacterized protein YlxW (UPF0749 family)